MDTMRDRFVNVTGNLLDGSDRLMLILADIGVSRFAESGMLERHPNRVVNVGIREQLLVSFAAGVALEGYRPVLHTYAPFLIERPFEQLKIDFAHQGAGGIFVSVGASYDWAAGGRTHQAPGDVALLKTLPEWRIHIPGHPDEVEALYRSAAITDERIYLRLAEDMNASAWATRDAGFTSIRHGSRTSPTVIAVGPMLERVIAATADRDVTVLYTATPHPLDAEALRGLMTMPDVVIAEPYLEGTSAGSLSAALSDVPHRLLSIGVPNAEHRKFGTSVQHDAAHGLDARGIRARIARFFDVRHAA